MNTLRSAARELADAAVDLHSEIEVFGDPPSRRQIEAIQNRINKVQRRLNRIQTETDTWSEETEAV